MCFRSRPDRHSSRAVLASRHRLMSPGADRIRHRKRDAAFFSIDTGVLAAYEATGLAWHAVTLVTEMARCRSPESSQHSAQKSSSPAQQVICPNGQGRAFGTQTPASQVSQTLAVRSRRSTPCRSARRRYNRSTPSSTDDGVGLACAVDTDGRSRRNPSHGSTPCRSAHRRRNRRPDRPAQRMMSGSQRPSMQVAHSPHSLGLAAFIAVDAFDGRIRRWTGDAAMLIFWTNGNARVYAHVTEFARVVTQQWLARAGGAAARAGIAVFVPAAFLANAGAAEQADGTVGGAGAAIGWVFLEVDAFAVTAGEAIGAITGHTCATEPGGDADAVAALFGLGIATTGAAEEAGRCAGALRYRTPSIRDSPLSYSTPRNTAPRRSPYSRFLHLHRWKRIGRRCRFRTDRRRSAGRRLRTHVEQTSQSGRLGQQSDAEMQTPSQHFSSAVLQQALSPVPQANSNDSQHVPVP